MRQVFLDHQSSTPVLPEVLERMIPFFTNYFGAPSSFHQQGLRARDAVALAREQAARLVNAESPEEILFTSSGTESANLAIKGIAYASQRRGNHLVASCIEHPALMNSIEFLEQNGFQCTRVRVHQDGKVDPEEIRSAMTAQTILVCIHLANHDIGTIQPVEAIAAKTNEAGIPLFVDASHAAGWLPINAQRLGLALVSLAPHRFYGPKGVGILYRHRKARLSGIIHGGVQEGGRRAGTENVPGLVGAGLACELAEREQCERLSHAAKLQGQLWGGLKERIARVRLNGPELGPGRIGNHLNISFDHVEGEALMLRLDLKGIAITSGTSCVSKSLKISPVLAAIGLGHGQAQGSVLMTLGKGNSKEEIDYVLEVFPRVVQQLRELSPDWDQAMVASGSDSLKA